MPEVFDPALKQFARAMRQGEPAFRDQQVAHAWRAARRQVIYHLLRIVSESEWRDNLILRGSVLLTTWLGEVAREPGDIDWVVTPSTLGVRSSFSNAMLDGLIRLVAERSHVGDIEILAAETAVDDIWTYDRAPGRRIVFPWRSTGLARGFTQLDFVFQQEMPCAAQRIWIHIEGGGRAELWTATPELSLAWKILWLETDTYPQGKDLYDATLLAEHVLLPRDLLLRVLEPSRRGSQTAFGPAYIRGWQVDWENFQREYPTVTGTASDWQERLVHALQPTFAETNP
ncbi:MAG TPA: nucleotidyl transferase AbiEii/AbiGii toxin family protein [Pirellulales bacterium]|nr:nucleotidyl transferase AbiEii/AbiGii toxin family protein [Pirellulales bacterium]